MLGIDVSNHQGRIGWNAAKADGVDFAWVKATEGRTYTDPRFLANLLGARDAGVPVGAYHYARPDHNSPEAEADHFLAVYHPEPGDLLPVLDFETPGRPAPQMNQWAKRWLELVEDALRFESIFYSYPYFISGTMAGAKPLAGAKLWLADYGRNDGKRHPSKFSFPHMQLVAHQFTSNGHVGGINGRVDLNFAESLVVLRPPVADRAPAGRRSLPGPARKPKWFWQALREYLSRRRGRK